jgi:YidC/Oxa1 family membrane protein insertase
MYRMQKLQPKIKELQQKHKNDKQKLGTEQMKLFREHGVSPFSGCLPMLLQMPILFALFYALRQTFEMRQSPFCGWITDLSLPDTVGHFPAGLPFLGGVAINILPLLMTVAMFFQQRMTPKSDDPQQQQQQKMMAFMPLLFAFMFYSMPSGLCLYWFTSTVLGMAEQYLIKRHLVKLGALAVPVKVRK